MVYTPAFGGSVPIKIDGTAATVAGGVITDVRAVAAGETVAIPANGYVMVFGSDFTSTAWYREPAVGTSVTLTPGLTDSDTSGFPMEEITAMVSGGPRLVENGAICTTLEPGFQEARFTSAVTSRTALGKLADGKLVIVSTGSQGENMSALYRMAFSTHKQVDITSGDRIIISASAIPGNEKAVSRIINELYRKGAEVVHEKSEGLHVSGHACQEELKIIHALVKPRFCLPVHGEQRHLQIHSKLAQSMGMHPRNIHIGEIGTVFEFTAKSCKENGTVPAGKVFVDGTGVGDVGSVVLRDRKHLAQDGMIVVCVNLSSQDGTVVSGPDIITRGFIYVKESEDLMESLRQVALEAIDRCQRKRVRDWSAIKSAIKNDMSGYLFKATKRNPMILPVIMEI